MLVACFIQANATIQYIRWGSAGNPVSGLTITWDNSSSTATHDSIQWGYSSTVMGTHAVGVKRTAYTGCFFKYVFPSTITPNSTIYYKLYDSGASSWGTQKSYIVAPDSSTYTYSFVAMGDCRDEVSTLGQLSTLTNAKHPAFTIMTGDLTASGSVASEWNTLFNDGATLFNNYLVYHCIGNHDNVSPSTYFCNNFDMPMVSGQNLYYSFVYGHTLFICLNSENATNSTMLSWASSKLAAASTDPNILWKVLYFHEPFYTCGQHITDMNSYLSTWWPMFDTYGVDMILNGHDHLYMRSKPINRSVSTTTPVATYGSGAGQGRCEIVCGGAGAPLYSVVSEWYAQTYQSTYNWCKLDLYQSGNQSYMCDSTFDNTGKLIETFCLPSKTITTGINEGGPKQIFNKIEAFPNPTKGSYTVKLNSADKGEGFVTIYDANGKEMKKEKIQKSGNDFEYTSNISGYARGLYYVEVSVGTQKDRIALILK